jgi:hypothetical protein
MIRQRRYNSVSSEAYWNLNRNGKVYPRMRKSAALLGAELPAVSDLAPYVTSFSSEPFTPVDNHA